MGNDGQPENVTTGGMEGGNPPEQQLPSGDPATTPPTATQPSTDWEARFKGLQTKYNVLYEEAGELKEQVDTLREERETLRAALEGKDSLASKATQDLSKQVSDRDKQISELTEQVDALRRYKAKMEIASSDEFSHLVEFAKLVPDNLSEEETREAFKLLDNKFKEKVATAVGARLESIGGSTPPRTKGDSRTRLGQLQDKMMSLPYGSDEYFAIQKEYDQLVDQISSDEGVSHPAPPVG